MNLSVSRFNVTPTKSIYTKGLTKNNSIENSNSTNTPKTNFHTFNELSSKFISFSGGNILIGVPKATDKMPLGQRANYAKLQTQEALKINSELKGIHEQNMKLMQDVIAFISKIDIKSSEDQSAEGINVTKTKRIDPLTSLPIFEMSEPKYGISEFSAQGKTYTTDRTVSFNKDGATYSVKYSNYCPEKPWITQYKITREVQNKNNDGIRTTTDEYSMQCNSYTRPVTIKRTIEERTHQSEVPRLISSKSTTFETEPHSRSFRQFDFKEISVENNEGNNHKKYTVSTDFGIETRIPETELPQGEYIFSDKCGQNVILNKDLTKAYLEGIVEINIPQENKQ